MTGTTKNGASLSGCQGIGTGVTANMPEAIWSLLKWVVMGWGTWGFMAVPHPGKVAHYVGFC